MQSKQYISAIKRIKRDLEEIKDQPIEGLAINQPFENDPFTLYCNVKILDGIYEGVILHMRMKVPQDYPVTAPSMWICSG